MINQLFSFRLADGTIQTSSAIPCNKTQYTSSFSIQPVIYPSVPNTPVMVMGDPYTQSNASTPVTLALYPNVYKIENNKESTNTWFIQTVGSTNPTASANIVSGSYFSSSLSNVYFDLQNLVGTPFITVTGSNFTNVINTIQIKPLLKNVGWNDSFIFNDRLIYNITSSTGVTIALVQMPYEVIFYGNVKNTPFKIWPTGTSCNASDVIVTNTNISALITPQNSAQFGYTAQASDARYIQFGGSIANAVSASYAKSASWAPSTGGGNSISASWASQSLSASVLYNPTAFIDAVGNASFAYDGIVFDSNANSTFANGNTKISLNGNIVTAGSLDAAGPGGIQLSQQGPSLSIISQNKDLNLYTPHTMSIEGDGGLYLQSGNVLVDNGGNISTVGNMTASKFVGTASWANNAVSASILSNPSASIGIDGSATFANGVVTIDAFGDSNFRTVTISSQLTTPQITSPTNTVSIALANLDMQNADILNVNLMHGTASYANTASYVSGSANSSLPTAFINIFPDGHVVSNGVLYYYSGSTTAGIQEAINLLPTASNYQSPGGGTIQFAPGTYYITNTIKNPNTRFPYTLQLLGSGMNACGIVLTGSQVPSNGNVINYGIGNFGNLTGSCNDKMFTIRDMFLASAFNTTSSILLLNGPGDPTISASIAHATIDNCWFGYWPTMQSQANFGYGGVLTPDAVITTPIGKQNLVGITVDCNFTNNVSITNCELDYLALGISMACDHCVINYNLFGMCGRMNGIDNDWPWSSPNRIGGGVAFKETSIGTPYNGNLNARIDGNTFIGMSNSSSCYIVATGFPWSKVSYNDSFESVANLIVTSYNPLYSTNVTPWTFVNPWPPPATLALNCYSLSNITNFSSWNSNQIAPPYGNNNGIIKVWDQIYNNSYDGPFTFSSSVQIPNLTASLIQGTATNAISASVATTLSNGTTYYIDQYGDSVLSILKTGIATHANLNYDGTADFVNSAISLGYTGGTYYIDQYGNTLLANITASGGLLGTASYANNVSASGIVGVLSATQAPSASYSSFAISTVSASWASASISASYAPGGSTATYTSSLWGTASWANNALTASSLISSSNYRVNGFTASNALFTASNSQIQFSYATLTTSSATAPGITCSFLDAKEYTSFITGSVTYTFTSSNTPPAGVYAQTSLYINNTFTGNTASLSFPAGWNFMGLKPTYLTASKVAKLELEAYGSTIVAAWAPAY